MCFNAKFLLFHVISLNESPRVNDVFGRAGNYGIYQLTVRYLSPGCIRLPDVSVDVSVFPFVYKMYVFKLICTSTSPVWLMCFKLNLHHLLSVYCIAFSQYLAVGADDAAGRVSQHWLKLFKVN